MKKDKNISVTLIVAAFKSRRNAKPWLSDSSVICFLCYVLSFAALSEKKKKIMPKKGMALNYRRNPHSLTILNQFTWHLESRNKQTKRKQGQKKLPPNVSENSEVKVKIIINIGTSPPPF